MASVHDSVTTLSGVGEKRAAALAKLGINNISELLRHFPRGYQHRGATVSLAEAAKKGGEGFPASVMLTVADNARSSMIRRGMTLVKVRAVDTDFPDSSLSAELTFFNQAYLKDRLRVGQNIRVWGRFRLEGRTCRSSSPILEFYTNRDSLCPITPVYPLSAGLSQNYAAKLISEALKCPDLEDCDSIPAQTAEKFGFGRISDAFRMIHKPLTPEETELARRRFAFEKIFVTSAALAASGSRRPNSGAAQLGGISIEPYLSALPFRLTSCQARAVGDIARDLASERPMKRMISGDVGSGKTAVAAAAAYITAAALSLIHI